MTRHLPLAIASFVLAVSLVLAVFERPIPAPDVVFVATPYPVVTEMLRLAELDANDVLYDLGCGDGRIPIEAARNYGARAVCIDIDPERVQAAKENVRMAGVGDRVRVVQADLFETDLSEATAVTLYLLPKLNLRLMPKLLRELRPGTPIVSHDFPMGDWKPEVLLNVKGPARTHKVFLWHTPAAAAQSPAN